MKLKNSIAIAVMGLFISPAFAADEWGIPHEKAATFKAKVVDILCELTKDCPANCGDGKRQLGLLTDDGKLIPVLKNIDPFAGGVKELIGYCNKTITADGLIVNNPKMTMFVIQNSGPAGGKLSPANKFGKDWAKANPGKPADEWYAHDKQIKAVLAKDGILGRPDLKLKK